ncbi:uncharacterized protein ANIA_11537 [Aspergillus nidulans FGSC A4]|uniref:Uncharacterized protein n=1 Tax=Emericella nidulans (strain FGSC A4 / ATCC 38163 / CBS 112.46 / NRRL 194 / M139) TaxID=227321 RepID=C8V3F7_EMENI|nr:hypothetical protein [Aspergillus nidulans FGSC A4]CBF71856.1 TPA: hypothetical protein ANIA_11537 [Aspergillus nidulans FGSC A4]
MLRFLKVCQIHVICYYEGLIRENTSSNVKGSQIYIGIP